MKKQDIKVESDYWNKGKVAREGTFVSTASIKASPEQYIAHDANAVCLRELILSFLYF